MQKPGRAHRNQMRYPTLWTAIDGAIRDAMQHHDDIQIPDKRRSSVVKRAVGAVLGLQGLGAGKPADTAERALVTPTASDAHPPGVAGLVNFGGQPHRRKSRKRRAKGMFPWPATAIDLEGRRALRAFLRIERTRFIAFHRGPGVLFVEVRR